MENTQGLVRAWFATWDSGKYEELPISADFKHHSPYGTIEGRDSYLNLVEANKDKFLGNRIELEDELYESDRACIRYTIHNPAFSMVVSEWLYMKNGAIKEIFAYYNIEGEISESRKLRNHEGS